MGSWFSGKKALALLLVVVVLAALGGAGGWWYNSNAAAKAKAQCLTNQRMIEAAAKAYVDAGPEFTTGQIEGAVDGKNPLVASPGSTNYQLLSIPRCPSRPNEFYVLHDGKTTCPIHGTYE